MFYKHCTPLLIQQDGLSKFLNGRLSKETSNINNKLYIPLCLQLLLFHHFWVFEQNKCDHFKPSRHLEAFRLNNKCLR